MRGPAPHTHIELRTARSRPRCDALLRVASERTGAPMTDGGDTALEAKLRDWFERPPIKQTGWTPRLFWRPAPDGPFGMLRVDPLELEVFFAAMLEQPSACAPELDAKRPGRAAFLAANARRHELPLFSAR